MEKNSSILTAIRVVFILVLIAGVIFSAVRLCKKSYDFGYRIFTEEAIDEEPGKDVIVEVPEGSSGKEIADLLEKKGLIRDAGLFRMQLRLSAYNGKLRSGSYTLNTSMDPKEIMAVLAAEPDTEEAEEDSAESSETSAASDSTEAENQDSGD